MGFKRGKSIAKVGNSHALQADATSNTPPTREQLSKELSAKVTKQDLEISKLEATIVKKDAQISKLLSDLKVSEASARTAWARLAEVETQLERAKDSLKTFKYEAKAVRAEASKDRAFQRRHKPAASEATDAVRKRYGRLAESVEKLLQQEPMLLQSMLEDTAVDGLPVYIEVLVAYLSRHRLAIPAALKILNMQPVTKLTTYLDTTDILRELEHYYTKRAVDEITKHWSATIGLAIRFRLGLSMENYERLRQMLSKSFDSESNVSTT
eukprot:gene25764-31520_t